MAFLDLPNEIPAGGFTRAQLLNMIKTAKPGSDFADGATIERDSNGALRVKEIAQSKVTNLVTDLAAKQALNSLLTQISNLSNNGLIFRNGSGSATVKTIGSDVQAFHAFLNALTLVADGVVSRSGDNAVALQIGTDLQAFNQKLQDIADISSLAAGDIIRWDGSNFVRVGRQSAVADVDDSDIPATISDPPTQAEVEGIRAALVKLFSGHHTLRDRFTVADGNGLVEDV